ncbi:MAG TPA: secondary thiamine-phosphate synthase enzyme YjbQ [bacterium]|nr:secondary thiamine-phosphate synthase enzyme YjbQ [bacterium]
MQTIKVKTTEKQRMIDVTKQIQAQVKESGVTSGICTVFCPHTTAAVTLQENADPDVKLDMLDALDRAVPLKANYRHAEGNSAAHIKASMIGSSVSVFVENRKLVLGSWQAIFFCEFDGPRDRSLLVRVIPDRAA